MSRIEDLQPKAAVRGILPDAGQACVAGMSYLVTTEGANSERR
jgi:hypothetical protein